MYLYQLTRNSKFRNFGTALCDIIVMYKLDTQLCVLYVQNLGRSTCLILSFIFFIFWSSSISPIYYIFLTFCIFFISSFPNDHQLSSYLPSTVRPSTRAFMNSWVRVWVLSEKKQKGRKEGRCVLYYIRDTRPVLPGESDVRYTHMCVMLTNLRTETETERCEVEV